MPSLETTSMTTLPRYNRREGSRVAAQQQRRAIDKFDTAAADIYGCPNSLVSR